MADFVVEMGSKDSAGLDVFQSIVGYYVVIAIPLLHIDRLLDETVMFETVRVN